MTTKVFISWSGNLSRRIAEEIRNWLPGVLQNVKPYFTPNDIEKGSKWNSEISKELSNTNIGIICLTRENISEPWILFESGALSKSMEGSNVCTILFNLEPADIKGPLTCFQSTKFDKGDIKKLIITINNCATDNKLEPEILDNVFDMWWPKIEGKVKAIIESEKYQVKEEKRSDRDILEEILELIRMSTRDVKLRSLSINSKNIEELIRIINNMFATIASLNYKKAVDFASEINSPLSYICKMSGNEDIYNLYIEFLYNKLSAYKPSNDGEEKESSQMIENKGK